MMTTYEKKCLTTLLESFGPLTNEELFVKLTEIGLIEHTMCKVAVIREHVRRLMESGVGKVDAMWKTTESFACTFEYVRHCVYYYRDVDLRP